MTLAGRRAEREARFQQESTPFTEAVCFCERVTIKSMFSNPKKNLEQFNLIPGMTVADFGSGVGYYAFEASKIVGDSGHVYAFDIQKEIVTSLAREAKVQNIKNLDALWVDLEKPSGSKLRSGTIDRVLLINVLFQLEKKDAVLQEITRVLRPSGKVLVVEWSDIPRALGPSGQAIVSESMTKEFFAKNGFALDRSINVGEHHYGLIFNKV